MIALLHVLAFVRRHVTRTAVRTVIVALCGPHVRPLSAAREVDEVLLPRARAELESPDHLAAKAAEFITTDRILEDLNLEEPWLIARCEGSPK